MTLTEPAPTAVLRLRSDRTGRLEALLLAAGPHLEPVLDVGTAVGGDLLLVLPAPAARLTDLLEAPGALTAGESVTVLVPLVQALLGMHAAGVAHGGVRAGAVVLDQEGSPSWTAPIAPTLLRAVGPDRFAERIADDLAGLRALGVALLGPAFPSAAPEELVVALFQVAAPEPVRLSRPEPVQALTPPGRLLPAARPAPVEVGPASLPPARPALPAVLAPLGRSLRTVRPRVWALLGAVVALLVAAGIALPSGAPAVESTRAAVPSATARSMPTSVATSGTDAATAVAALLVARATCLERGSESCLRTVDAVDSPVLDADLRAMRSGAEPARIDPRGLRVTANGGTALATTGGATVLAISDRNGWRLRDVVAEPPED